MAARSKESCKPLALVGFMGAGKTVVAEGVGSQAGAAWADLDRLVEARAGAPVAGIFARQGEAEFRRLESAALPAALVPGTVLALGGGTWDDGGNLELTRQRALTVWLDASFDVLWARIAAGGGRPLLGLGRDRLQQLLERRRPAYAQAHHRVDASPPLATVVAEVAALWCG